MNASWIGQAPGGEGWWRVNPQGSMGEYPRVAAREELTSGVLTECLKNWLKMPSTRPAESGNHRSVNEERRETAANVPQRVSVNLV